MFKKTLIASALLGAMVTSSFAAEVTLYGIADMGLVYTNQSFRGENPDYIDGGALTLDSGVNSASRFGLKGKEELGNGYTVSFKLENGFDADDGELGQNSRLFGREASLSVSADWGTLSAGRMGGVGSSAGTYDTVFAIGDAFDGGDNDMFAMVTTGRYDNMLTYRTPKAGGLQATAQYSLKIDNKSQDANEQEGHSSADRYASLAVTGEFGGLQTVASYEQIMYSTEEANIEDAKIISVGGNYDFDIVKVFAMGQYFEDAPINTINREFTGEGYSLHGGVQIPVWAGVLTSGVYYTDFDAEDEEKAEQIAGSVKYEYPLSARTSLYGSVGFAQLDYHDWTQRMTQAYCGITHTF